MSDRSYRRLTRYALLALVTLPVVLVVAASPMPDQYAALVVLAMWLPFYPAIGPYQADLALNTRLDENLRRWWRIALFLLPWSMAVYWHRHVRR
jgi:hypothetical protein